MNIMMKKWNASAKESNKERKHKRNMVKKSKNITERRKTNATREEPTCLTGSSETQIRGRGSDNALRDEENES